MRSRCLPFSVTERSAAGVCSAVWCSGVSKMLALLVSDALSALLSGGALTALLPVLLVCSMLPGGVLLCGARARVSGDSLRRGGPPGWLRPPPRTESKRDRARHITVLAYGSRGWGWLNSGIVLQLLGDQWGRCESGVPIPVCGWHCAQLSGVCAGGPPGYGWCAGVATPIAMFPV